jgi:hypothetical protein
MLTETTVSKLREMRLSVMANALKDQLADPQFQNMAFEDRIGLLVDAEWNARKNNHLNKLRTPSRNDSQTAEVRHLDRRKQTPLPSVRQLEKLAWRPA